MDSSQFVKCCSTFKPWMSVKEMECGFQVYNLCKAIAPQKGCISFKSVQKANAENGFIFYYGMMLVG